MIRDADNRDWTRGYLRHLLDTLPPPVMSLLAHTRATVGNTLVSHRT
ncbi:hypothetical protein [Phytohabitans rumicis]|uniref:Uncharacterized protein n=1 Tax=Phytohabitans rumicis TaxID=1076125 RepID=A0A6V8LH55_9ACTN|nr:hypothetical protein [Phytohabitans rumicis]GFJ93417.1 hypothetical protein Prum_070590 [Phytohabitans rumicis]